MTTKPPLDTLLAVARHLSGGDELLGRAQTIVIGQQRASISLIQRHLHIGYART